ncbi:hypothetical protein COL23_19920, partial [Priestia aryabhattai]
IAALALGIDGVEGERRFPGAGKAGHDDQLVAWQVKIDALEIVLARTTYGNSLQFAHRRMQVPWSLPLFSDV